MLRQHFFVECVTHFLQRDVTKIKCCVNNFIFAVSEKNNVASTFYFYGVGKK